MAGNEHSGRNKAAEEKIAVQLRLSPADHAKWSKEAKEEMMSLAAYLYKKLVRSTTPSPSKGKG